MKDYSPVPTHWYTEEEAIAVFGVPKEQMQAIFLQAVENEQTPIAYYHGYDYPMIIGAFLIKRLTGKTSIV